jgi:hypothetical protein
MKTRLVEAELFHADGRRDIMKLIVVFRNFANEPKKLNKKCMVKFKVKCIAFVYFIYSWVILISKF